MSEVLQVPNIIGGQRVEAATWFDVHDPGRPQVVVGRAADGGADHVDRAVEAAVAAGPSWASVPLEERVEAVRRGLQRMKDAIGDLAPVLVQENGALLREAQMDLQRGVELMGDMAGRALKHLQPTVIEDETSTITVLRQPIGPIGMVVPWNSPMVLAASKVSPALAAGNTVILKPSPEAPLAVTLAMTLLAEELPDGVLNIVNSSGSAGRALSAHPQVRKISFTGSTEVGRAVMASCARTLKRTSLELGGNDAAIVLEDVEIETALDSLARGVFTRGGQICFAVKRIYVARSRFTEFVEAFCRHVDTFVCGHGLDPESTYGPVISAQQVDHLEELVEDARRDGAEVRVLGKVAPEAAEAGGHYVRPTVVTGVSQTSRLVAEEQFGPVIPIIPFDDIDEAVALANDSEFGLASSVWSSDLDAAAAVGARLEAGCTFINSHNIWSLSFDMPFGGVKQSGLGRERTELGLDEYVETHSIRVPRVGH